MARNTNIGVDRSRGYSRLAVMVAVIVGAVVATLVSLVASAAMSAATGESSYVPLTPARILDTRPAPLQTGEYNSPWPADTTRSLTVTGVGGIPATGVKAVVLNITTVNPTGATSWLTVFPTGQPLPTAASVNFVAGEIKNDVVIAAVGAGGKIDIYNTAGNVDLVIDVNGYYTDSVEARLAQVETLLAGLSRETVDGHDTLRLTGANLQIVDGTGDTYGTPNGLGNLIVGYNANGSDTRTGSHNLIVGDEHHYSANGTVLFGFDNATTNNAAALTGGAGNTASGFWSSVTGGSDNTASGGSSSVTGGFNNTASGTSSSVTGGAGNTASGEEAVVSGGFGNTASGSNSTVGGGTNRSVTGVNDWRAGDLFEDS